jgi:hypothetical protein
MNPLEQLQRGGRMMVRISRKLRRWRKRATSKARRREVKLLMEDAPKAARWKGHAD